MFNWSPPNFHLCEVIYNLQRDTSLYRVNNVPPVNYFESLDLCGILSNGIQIYVNISIKHASSKRNVEAFPLT